MEDMRGAVLALNSRDVEDRSACVNHALLILEQLQGKLDFSAGGTAACQLNAFYSHVRGKLLEAQIKQSPQLLLDQINAVVQIRKCWAAVERGAAAVIPSWLVGCRSLTITSDFVKLAQRGLPLHTAS